VLFSFSILKHGFNAAVRSLRSSDTQYHGERDHTHGSPVVRPLKVKDVEVNTVLSAIAYDRVFVSSCAMEVVDGHLLLHRRLTPPKNSMRTSEVQSAATARRHANGNGSIQQVEKY
jgi:hypothetical protein